MAWASSYKNGECTVAKKIMTPQTQINARALTFSDVGFLNFINLIIEFLSKRKLTKKEINAGKTLQILQELGFYADSIAQTTEVAKKEPKKEKKKKKKQSQKKQVAEKNEGICLIKVDGGTYYVYKIRPYSKGHECAQSKLIEKKRYPSQYTKLNN